MQREDRKPLYDETREGEKEKDTQQERRTSHSETDFGEAQKVALSPFAFGAGLAMCQCCDGPQRRTEVMERRQQEGEDRTEKEICKIHQVHLV